MAEAVIDPFRIREHVHDFNELMRNFAVETEAARRRWHFQSNVRYGSHPDECLDLYFPDDTSGRRPVHMFLHPGYWRAFAKDDFGFVANTICATGGIAAVVDYSLMPRARMSALVHQVRRALLWLARHAETFDGNPNSLSASGHSAGAHLAAWLFGKSAKEQSAPDSSLALRSVLLVSGLYDLQPVSQSFLQKEIALTRSEIEEWSPLNGSFSAGPRVQLCVGENETAPFHLQMNAYLRHLERSGVRVQADSIHGLNHMTIVRDLGRPQSAAAAFLAKCIRASLEPPGGSQTLRDA